MTRHIIEGDWYFRNSDGKIIPQGQVYKPTMYDASRDVFVDQDDVREPAALFAIQPVFDGASEEVFITKA